MKKFIKYSVVGITANVNSDDKLYISTIPVNAVDKEINPSGRFGLTIDQLASIANSMTIPTARILQGALSKGDCTIIIPVELRKVGEEYTDQNGNVHQFGLNDDGSPKRNRNGDVITDWYQSDMINSTIELGNQADAFVERTMETAISNDTAKAFSIQDAKNEAKRRKTAQQLALVSGNSVSELLGETQDTEFEEEVVKKTTKNKSDKE